VEGLLKRETSQGFAPAVSVEVRVIENEGRPMKQFQFLLSTGETVTTEKEIDISRSNEAFEVTNLIGQSVFIFRLHVVSMTVIDVAEE
jgi:hypothetical protein